MQTIHKFIAEPKPGIFHIKTGRTSPLLKVANQDEKITIWYAVKTDEERTEFHYVAYLTGETMPPELVKKQSYIDTILFDNGSYVLHIYSLTHL